MKELKRGDFVWSKRYGNGIVSDIEAWSSWSSGVLFEDHDQIVWCARGDLFAKGDEVEVIEWRGSKIIPEGIFIGITHNHVDNCKLVIKNNNTYDYVINIKHKSTDKLEIILTMNGKEIDAKTISQETWDNLRRMK